MSTLTSTTPKSKSGGPHRKPRADVYTFMLIVALIAIVIAIVCLYFEMKRFDFDFKGAPKPPPATAAVLPAQPATTLVTALPQQSAALRPAPA